MRYHFWLRIRIGTAASLTLLLTGCAALWRPTTAEMRAVSAGQKTIVLWRVKPTVEGQPCQPDSINFGLGTFQTGGKPKPVLSRSLSSQSRREGWTFLVLAPGTYYLALRPPQSTDAFSYARLLEKSTRWRLDVPENARMVYAGTLRVEGGGRWMIFGGRAMDCIRDEKIVDADAASARKLLAQHFPDAGDMRVVLLQRHEGGPLILRSPLPK